MISLLERHPVCAGILGTVATRLASLPLEQFDAWARVVGHVISDLTGLLTLGFMLHTAGQKVCALGRWMRGEKVKGGRA